MMPSSLRPGAPRAGTLSTRSRKLPWSLFNRGRQGPVLSAVMMLEESEKASLTASLSRAFYQLQQCSSSGSKFQGRTVPLTGIFREHDVLPQDVAQPRTGHLSSAARFYCIVVFRARNIQGYLKKHLLPRKPRTRPK